ncbi:DEAD/DEAH box helicase [candidate division KSB1 bacterium]|nr:DEAD/DEAH box helicase [candidate division KSB1 bacterium]
MPTLPKYLSERAVEKMRAAIAETGGNEVFFIGFTEEDLVVHEVTAVARGHKSAVPAVMKLAMEADVVIHNHPSGGLQPSEADLSIAAALDPFSVGFYIVDNEVENIYVVVEPFAKRKKQPLDIEKLVQTLRPNGLVAMHLPGYEDRPQQEEMIKTIARAFNEDKLAIIEAGTGTGKSLAYLLPAIHWSIQNRGRVVVSTNTINLQEQLIKKDIPFLRKVVPQSFTAVLVKGRGNYACLRKVAEVAAEFDLLSDEEEREELQGLIDWVKKSKDGSKADLAYIPRDLVWEKIGSESDTCTRSRCPFFRECFVNKARRNAARANLLVVNHHLLFADLAIRHQLGSISEAAVLPPYECIIFDEAQHLEDVATHYFGDRITRAGIVRILSRLHRQQKSLLKGHLHTALHRLYRKQGAIEPELVKKIDDAITSHLVPELISLQEGTHEIMDHIYEAIKTYAHDSKSSEIKLRLIPDVSKAVLLDSGLARLIKEYTTSLNDLADALNKLVARLDKAQQQAREDWHSNIIEIRAQAERLNAAAAIIEEVVFQQDEDRIRWIEIKPGYRSRNIVRFFSSPLDISHMMQQAVYDVFNTIVMTSATLTVEQKFDFLSQRLGMQKIDPKRRLDLLLPAPFDYEKQAILCIPLDIPDPNSKLYADELAKLVYRGLTISNGRAFVLFTSYGLLNIVHRQLSESLKMLGITALKQGNENRHELLSRFRRDKNSVLFATDSFWEGVDVEGEALENVVITKLPFKVPNEPIVEARYEAIERRGGNAFMDYAVPLAVLKFKQGFGRLIRRKTDRGSVLIFDNRVITKTYGKRFLRSLPPSRLVSGPQQLVFAELEKFFSA